MEEFILHFIYIYIYGYYEYTLNAPLMGIVNVSYK